MTAEPTVAESAASTTPRAVEAALQNAEAVRLDLAKALSRPRPEESMHHLIARAGASSAQLARIVSTLEAENERLRAALKEAEKRLTQAVGIIAEFGDLNGFRNLSDQELGAAVLRMAKAGAATIDHLRAALSGDPK